MPSKQKTKQHMISLGRALDKANNHPTASCGTNKDHFAVDIVERRQAAAMPVFTVEDIGVSMSKRMPTTGGAAAGGMKTVLTKEAQMDINRRIQDASRALGSREVDTLQVEERCGFENFTRSARFLMPRRPNWDYEDSSGRLHHREVSGFKKWLDDVVGALVDRGGYAPAFEQNLQVWRQLWRVLERCDVAVVVLDARHPLLHFAPALYAHIKWTLQKPLVLVLNKLDTVSPEHARRWADALKRGLPGVSEVVGFSQERLRPDSFATIAFGKQALLEACHRAVQQAAAGEHQSSEGTAVPTQVVLGCVGQPNVGKSSIINALYGEKTVSVKATPGHTKILQTVILDDRTCLCDSPGLVFPRLEVPREVQIIGALIPIAQVREPFSAIRWLAAHCPEPLGHTLKLKPYTFHEVSEALQQGVELLRMDHEDERLVAAEASGGELPWSVLSLCTRYAVQRGLVRNNHPDSHTAGLKILERVLEGRIPYAVPAPDACEGAEDNGGEPLDDYCYESDGSYESEEEDGLEAAPEGLFDELWNPRRARRKVKREARRKVLDGDGDTKA